MTTIVSKAALVNGAMRKVRCFPGYAVYNMYNRGGMFHVRGYLTTNKKGQDVFKAANKHYASLLAEYEPKLNLSPTTLATTSWTR